jgi:pimeloyl-ACP methyl ester carboxylesterase
MPVEGFELLPSDLLGVSETDAESGFQAAIYARPADGTIMVALAGTQDRTDWMTNIKQGVGLVPDQYDRAAQLVAAAKSKYGDRVVVVGHSLGGGLATYAALSNHVRAQTYNAAGLGLGARAELWLDKRLEPGRDLITHLNLSGEGLTSEPLLSNPLVSPERVGRVLEVAPPDPTPLGITDPIGWAEKRYYHDHLMEQVNRALDGSAELRPVRGPREAPVVPLCDAANAVNGAAADWLSEAADDAGDVMADAARLIAKRAAAAIGLISKVTGVSELIEGDQRVHRLAAQGRRREAVVAMSETVGAFSGAVVDAGLGVVKKAPFLGGLARGVALTEGGRSAGAAIGRAANEFFDVRDRSNSNGAQLPRDISDK